MEEYLCIFQGWLKVETEILAYLCQNFKLVNFKKCKWGKKHPCTFSCISKVNDFVKVNDFQIIFVIRRIEKWIFSYYKQEYAKYAK